MEHDFNVGDTVRRINLPWGGMAVGATGVVTRVTTGGIVLKGHDATFESKNFELVESVTPCHIIVVMDASGSMDRGMRGSAGVVVKKVVNTLKDSGREVTAKVIVHTTSAEIVDAERAFNYFDFVGGTLVSSGLKMALEIIKDIPRGEEVHLLHITDGDNFLDDNKTCVEVYKQLKRVCDTMSFLRVLPNKNDHRLEECDLTDVINAVLPKHDHFHWYDIGTLSNTLEAMQNRFAKK